MTTPVTGNPSEFTREQRIFTMLGTLLGVLLAALDQTIVSTAGPAIQADLRIEPSLYAWITTSYLIGSTLMVPIYGKLSDLYGRRPILLVGIGVFLGGSLLCGVSQTAWQLIAARAVQGVGSAALFTTAFAVVADIFPPSERGKYQGLFGAMFGLSSVIGPLVGGLITDTVGWHWVFFVNLPVGAVAVAFILAKMPAIRPVLHRTPSVDWAGAAMLTLFVIPLLVALSLGRTEHTPGAGGWPWSSWQIVSMFAVSAGGLVAFLFVERRAHDPILPLELFRNRAFALGNLAAFVLGAAFLASIVFLPLFMVNVVGLSATRSGLTITPLTFGLIFGNVLSGQIVSRTGRYKRLLLVALVFLLGAYAIMGFTLSPDSTQGELTWKMILVGIGLGPSIPIYTLAIQNAVAPHEVGVASSAATFFRQMGSTIGVAILGTAFATSLGGAMQRELAAATEGIPPGLRAQVERPSAGGGGAEGPDVTQVFPREEIEARIRTDFAEQRAALDAAANGDLAARQRLLSDSRVDDRVKEALEGPAERLGPGLAAARAGLEQAETRALEAVGKVARGIKNAFTIAIKQIYRFALLIALLGLVVTVVMPDLPLRRTHARTPPPLE